MRHAVVFLIFLMLTTALAVGCGSDPTPTPAPESTPTPEPAATPTAEGVSEDGGATEPGATVTSEIADLTLEDLTIKAGTTVVWKNLDSVPHTATSGASPAADGDWGTDVLGRDQSAEGITFTEAGTFAYFCTIHPNMTATLTVTG